MPYYYGDDIMNWLHDSTWINDGFSVTLTSSPEPIHTIRKKPRKALPNILHVQFNRDGGHTTIVWDDDTSTTVGCAEGSEFEEYVGFCAAVAKKLFGSTSAVKKLIEEKDVDAARKRKTKEREERIRQQQEFERQNHERAVRRAAKKKLFDAEVDEMVQDMMKERDNHDA